MKCPEFDQAASVTDPAPIWKKLLWFIGLWASSVATLGVVAFAIKLLLK